MSARGSVPNDRLIAILLSASVLIVYSLTMCRTLYAGDDDGDFITCMATWGNTHPTGYPVYLLVGRLFLWLLSGVLKEPAARINWMTALFGSASIGFFYRFLVTGLRVERFWAASGALLLAFTPTLWQLSLSCEVYVVTCLYLCALLYTASLWRMQPQNTRLLRGLTLLYGLACTHHLTIVLFLPGFLAFVLYYRPALLRREPRVLLSLVGLFVLPLTFYAYLPLAAIYGHSPLNWGDPSTPQRFWYKITGAQYRPSMFLSWRTTRHDFLLYTRLLWNEFRPWTLWLAPFGVAALWRRDRPLCLLLIYIWLANVVFASNYHIINVYMYYIPSYVATAAFITCGASFVLGWIWDRCGVTAERRAHYTPLVAIVALMLVQVHMSLHFEQADESGNYLAADYSENILRSAPPGAIVVTGDMTIESLWYRKFVLRERPDVTPINRDLLYGSALPYMRWYYDQLCEMYPDIRNTDGGAPPSKKKIVQGQFLMDVLQRALQRGVPVLWIPNDFNERTKMDLMKAAYAELIGRNFDTVVWGVGQRLYLKGQAPGPEAVFAANAQIRPTFVYHDLPTWAHVDSLQQNVPLRYFNALMAWAQLCEMERRYDLALQAYHEAQQLYPNQVPDVQAGLDRCTAALAAPRTGSAPRKD